MWSSTRILWDQQILLMWILLPPIFIACGLLALVGPYLVPRKEKEEGAREEFVPNRAAMVERRS